MTTDQADRLARIRARLEQAADIAFLVEVIDSLERQADQRVAESRATAKYGQPYSVDGFGEPFGNR